MRQSPLLLLFLGLSATVQADSLSDENARLKQQVSALQSRVETLERACPAASSSAVVVQPGVAAVAPPPAAPLPAPPVRAAAVAAPSPAAPPSLTAAANVEGTPQPSDSASVAARDAIPKQKYADTGCDRGLFSGPQAGRWQKLSNWNAVTKGLTPAEVEAAVGVEHYDVELHNGRTQWQYGRCSSGYDSAVEFLDGRVVAVTPPDR